MIFTDRERDRYTFKKQLYAKELWRVDWPRAEGRESWKNNLHVLAGRCGHNIVLEADCAIITEPNGRVTTLRCYSCVGDFRTIFLEYIDAIMTGAVDAPPVETVFPPVETRPVNPALRDGFTINVLKDPVTCTHKNMLRVLRPVTYSEFVSIDGTCKTVESTGAFRGHKTEFTLIECACGRLFVGHAKILSPGAWQWTSCGCADTLNSCGYTGNRVDTLRAAWREWCTMKLIATTPQASLHSLLIEDGATLECALPKKFEEFWRWYLYNAKKNKWLYLKRIDKTKPFAMDNLVLEQPRYLISDPANLNRFKVGV